MFKILFLVVLIGALVPASDAQCTAPRVRRAWRNLARAEQELYVEAVLLLKQRGTYDQFVNMHTSTQTVDYAHGASGFLPWHRWFLYQFENALRALGPRFQCITVPYWDWERESSTRRRSSILGDLFGNYITNAPAEGACVRDGRFTLPNWRTTEGQCLLRAFDDGPGGMGFAGESEVAGYITRVTQYGSAEAGFRGTMEGLLHGAPHVWIGGDMGAFGSPNDPVFFLHHANVDRIWALWQDCHDYDRVDYNAATIRNQIYPWFQTSNTPGVRDGPVDPMPFTHSNGRRDERFYTGLPTGQAAPLPLDMMRIMGNRRVTSMSYAYDPADSLKGLLDRTGARCNWNWFILPNAVLPAPATPTPTPPNPTPNTTTPARAVCGNGIVETGEQCDEAARTCGTCVNCQLLCGNGVVDCGEDCDDGNRLNGDACPATCRRAHAWRRIRSDLTLKRDGTLSTEYDAETLAYMNGELSWEDYMFPAGKRSAEQGRRKNVYSTFRVKDDNSTQEGNSSFPSLRLRRTGGPVSAYLIFGKAPEPPKNWANPLMDKLGSSICDHNPMTKFAHAKAKLEMLTYVEAEMEGCRKRANDKWIAMTKMNATRFQPPCKGTFCCKVADMVSEKMVCDGGTVAVPSCNVSTCTWNYDCGNATSAHDDEPKNATRPRSVYYRAAAIGSEGQSYDGNSNGNSVGLSDTAKIGLGVGGGVLLAALIVGIVIVSKGKIVETA